MTNVVRFRVEAPAPTAEQVRVWFESNGWVSSGEHRWRHPNNPSHETQVPPDEYSVERIAYASCMYSGRAVMPDQVYRELCGVRADTENTEIFAQYAFKTLDVVVKDLVAGDQEVARKAVDDLHARIDFLEQALEKTASASELDKWREVSEAAHEVVSLMTEDLCEECSCPLPETSEDPHDKGCKVGRLVHALSAVGIDPNDR